jgi:hypothetical protein
LADLASRDQEEHSNEPRIPDGAKYATSEQLAARYQLSVQWVEARAANLGATPISDGANSKLRYHLATADAFMGRQATPAFAPGSRRWRPQAEAEEADAHPHWATAARRRVNRR